jgi:hypothetical protein
VCVGQAEGFYRSRLTDLGLLLPAEPDHASHNTALLECLFSLTESVAALLGQYSDLRDAAGGVHKLRLLLKVAKLTKERRTRKVGQANSDQIGRSAPGRDLSDGFMTSDNLHRPILGGVTSLDIVKESSSTVICLQGGIFFMERCAS